MAKVLVTGGGGHIGGFVCKELLNRGHEVTIYDYKPTLENISDVSSRLDLVRGDITDLDELLGTMRSREITDVIHLAALLALESRQRPARALQVNCVGTSNILEAARLMDLNRVVYTSSVLVYGKPDSYSSMLVDEDDFPRCPDDPYPITKFLIEEWGQHYRNVYGLDLTCLRVTVAWGPGRYSGYTGQVNDFIRRTAIGNALEFPKDFAYGGSKLRWLYVKDAARALVHGIEIEKQRIKRLIYNTGSRKPFKALDVVSELNRLLPNSQIELVETDKPTPPSSGIAGPSGLDVDCSRLYDELGFEEEYGLGKGMKDMVNLERSKVGLSQL